jgi:hypothetical protein
VNDESTKNDKNNPPGLRWDNQERAGQRINMIILAAIVSYTCVGCLLAFHKSIAQGKFVGTPKASPEAKFARDIATIIPDSKGVIASRTCQ